MALIEVQGEIVLEGIRYKYSVQLRDERMGIWLQSLGSAKQWYKGNMEKTDCVTPANAIPVISTLTPTDYLECLRDALECQSGEVDRTITSMEGDCVRLELTMNIRFLSRIWAINFEFDLEPFAPDRIDSLVSKERCQQDELSRMKQHETKLQRELAELRKQVAAPCILLQASHRDTIARLQWEPVGSDSFVLNGRHGDIRIREPGVYTIGVCASGISKVTGQISLWKNGRNIHQVQTPVRELGTPVTTMLALTARFDKDDTLSIRCHNFPASGTSYLSIARLSTQPIDLC